jgi:hypothetical protein
LHVQESLLVRLRTNQGLQLFWGYADRWYPGSLSICYSVLLEVRGCTLDCGEDVSCDLLA